MGFSLTSPAPKKCDPTAENRVWGFFGEAPKTSRGNHPQSLQPRQGNRPSTTTIASGRTYWPSRDPISETGFLSSLLVGVNRISPYETPMSMGDSKEASEEFTDDEIRELMAGSKYGFVSNDPVGSFDIFGLKQGECKELSDEGNHEKVLASVPQSITAGDIKITGIKFSAKTLAKKGLKVAFHEAAKKILPTAGLVDTIMVSKMTRKFSIVGVYRCCVCDDSGKSVSWSEIKFYSESVNNGRIYAMPANAKDASADIDNALLIAERAIEDECEGVE